MHWSLVYCLFLHNRKTGIVYNVTKTSLGVVVHKRVRHRYMEKKINVRIEHVKHSKCRDDFLQRVKKNAALKAEAKASGVMIQVKRQPALPRSAHFVSMKGNLPLMVTPVPYEGIVFGLCNIYLCLLALV